MSTQLPLGLGLRDNATFSNYCGRGNEETLTLLRYLSRGQGEHYVYLRGEPGLGKTHLLQAVCHAADAVTGRAVYIPLALRQSLSPELLEGLENTPLTCLDDIDSLHADSSWQTAVFHLFNRIRERGNRLLVAGTRRPTDLGIELADLASRLASGPAYRLKPLDDDAKRHALSQRAEQRGLDLSDEACTYLMHRAPRNTGFLFEFLVQLDHAALAAQRRITVPFIREQLKLTANTE